MPTALIILLDSPMKCLIYVIFILVLQQIDGNIIGPKILGSSTGINGFWIMFAILLGGGLFGSDNGRPYDPTEKPDPDTTQSAEEREVGGLGIFMVKKLMDEVTYEYADGSNILTLVKSL